METKNQQAITVETTVHAPVAQVWKYWTSPEHIRQWNMASEDWHTPHAENDLRKGGEFKSRMEARDGSAGFDFHGVYDAVEEHAHIAYTMDDGRKVSIRFREQEGETTISETFDPESINPMEMQRGGWQAILDHFRKYVENQEQ